MQYLSKATLAEHPPKTRSEEVTVCWLDTQGQKHIAKVTVIEMTVADRTRFDESLLQFQDGETDSGAAAGVREALVIACTRGEDGLPLFSSDDARSISEYGTGLIEPIVNVAQRLNKISSNDLEELAKN